MLIVIQIGLLIFLGVLLLIAATNLRRLRRLGDYPASAALPMISVCLPARNEEASIRACVGSLARQDYPHYEVLILDDESTDGTPQILAELEREHSQVRVLRGEALPPDWLGKHWACHQLAEAASGELLLFTDADTRHHPLTLRHAADALAAEDADLLAALPRHEVKSWAERLMIPIISWSILSLLPLELAYRIRLPMLSAAIGQFMLFRRAAYFEIGGHAAVRDSIVDDLALARRIKAHGLRWRLADATRHVTCRMYRHPHEVVEGLGKNLFAVFNRKPAAHLFVWLWLLIVFCAPPGLLMAALAGAAIPPVSLGLAAAAVGGSLILWALTYQRLGFGLPLALLYPLTIACSVWLALRSMMMTRRGQITWKGRTIATVQQTQTAIPMPDAQTGLRALKAIWRERSIMPALSVFHEALGDIFRIRAGNFQPVILAGPEACHFVLVTEKHNLSWRPEGDPVTSLLRDGLLMQDGESHDALRRLMNPALHRRMLERYTEVMRRRTDEITSRWKDGQSIDMLDEMRRLTLLILMETLFDVDFTPHLAKLLPSILRTVAYISPGAWLIWPGLPRPGYARHLREVDHYLHEIIRERRDRAAARDDILSLLVQTPDLSDDLIRDQLLTLLIAGHDTSTALLSWALYRLGQHPDVLARVRDEVDTVLGEAQPTLEHLPALCYLDQVIQETLRLHPPIHIGNRIALRDIAFRGFRIPAGTRVAYSIYLTHRDPAFWVNPDQFDPDRFAPVLARQHVPYSYLPFGSGARNCIGMAFAQVEAKVVLARLIQTVDFEPAAGRVQVHMGATLEPRPGVSMQIQRRNYQ